MAALVRLLPASEVVLPELLGTGTTGTTPTAWAGAGAAVATADAAGAAAGATTAATHLHGFVPTLATDHWFAKGLELHRAVSALCR